MELRVLGPIEVRHDGSPVLLRGTKPRELLVLLAIRANHPVGAEQLIDELWEGDPPPSASTALRVHINRLRRILELDRSPHSPSARLPAGPHGYLLRVEPDELDAQRFERLVAFARDANANGDPAGAVPHLTDAFDLWRGTAYADARDLSAARSEVARLEELRAVAFEELADARLALVEHPLVVDVLTAAVREFPLRERLTGQLMLALYRCGRQADALRAFAEIAGRLDRQLGVVPSPELRRLEEDILMQRSTLQIDRPRLTNPALGQRRSSTVRFIGRRAEIGQLMDLYAAAKTGDRAAAFVRGTAGIGKTTLIEEFAARCAVAGGDVLIGRCAFEQRDGYQAVADVVRTIVERLDDAARATIPVELGVILPELGLPELGLPELGVQPVPESVPPPDQQSARLRLHEAVAAFFNQHTSNPRVLLVEDVHWANKPMLALLRHLIRRRDSGGLLLVATYRDDEIVLDRAERVESLLPPGRVRHVDLSAFDDNEVRAVVRVTAAPELLPRLLELSGTIRDVSGGNPLVVRELLRDLDDDEAKLDDDLERRLSTMAPAGVRAIVDRRVEQLTPTATCIVRAMAVLGDGISTPILAAVCGVASRPLLDGLEECLATRLLIEDTDQIDRFSFPHALIRAAIYPTIAPDERLRLHARVAAVLETVPTTTRAELAHHWCEAAPLGLHDQAAAAADNAGNEACRAFAFGQAADWFERAVAHQVLAGKQPATLGRLALALGRSYAQDGQFHRARDVFATAADAARQTEDRALLAEVALEVASPWSSRFGQQLVALELLEAALTHPEGVSPCIQVQLLNALASALYYIDPEREECVARYAGEIAQQVNDETARATSYLALHRWYTHQPPARSERLALAKRALELTSADVAGGQLHLRIHRELLADLLENACIDEFASSLDAYERSATELTSPRDIYWAMAMRATQHTLRGDLAAAEQQARGAALRGIELDQSAAGALMLHTFVIHFQQGRLQEDLAQLQPGTKPAQAYRAGAALIALARAETRHLDEVETIARQVLGADGDGLARDVFWLGAVAMMAAAVARSSRDGALLDLISGLLAPCAEHVVVFGTGGAVLGTGHHWLGQLALARDDPRRALEHLLRAVELSEQLAAPYWLAQAELDAATALEQCGGAGDRLNAVALRRKALDVAERQGYSRLCRHFA
jgi:DNA-binding SARP family transcriptional activator